MKVRKLKCTIGETKILSGLSTKQRRIVKNQLTFDNPAYANAVRHSRRPEFVSLPEHLYFFTRLSGNRLEVPVRYVPPFPIPVVQDKSVVVPVKYPKWKIKLRKDQQKALEAYVRNPDKGILMLPTGGGKTVLGHAIASKLQQKLLVITHRNDLVRNWTNDACFLLGLKPKDIGLIQGKTFKIGKQITIATVQTLSKRDISKLKDVFGMIIMDETHHCPAKTYTEVLSQFRARYRLGLTATLERKDGLDAVVRHYFGEVGFEKTESDDIMPVEIRLLNTDFVKRKIRKRVRKFGRYVYDMIEPTPEELLKQLYSDRERNEFIMQFIEGSVNQGNNVVVFTHRVAHAELLFKELKKRRLPVALLTGKVKDRDKIFEQIEQGKIRCSVATFHLVKEGINIKAWNRGFAVTPSSDRTECIQAIGRIRRTHPKKKEAIWYDFRDIQVKKFKSHASKRMNYWKEISKNIVRLED